MSKKNNCPVGYVILKSGKIVTCHYEDGKLFGTPLKFKVLSELINKEDYDEAEIIEPGHKRKA